MPTLFPTVIETERLRLRRPMQADADAIFSAYTQDKSVAHFMVWRPHTSSDATHEFISSCIASWDSGTAYPYILTLKNSDSAIGMLEARPKAHLANIGYVLARERWGQGLMPEAIKSFAALALSLPSMFRVEASCDIENVASARTLEKAGFLREGKLGRYTVHPNISSEPRDCWLYAKCR
jgi:RimJ/RimL family protein N-acetyltransferase